MPGKNKQTVLRADNADIVEMELINVRRHPPSEPPMCQWGTVSSDSYQSRIYSVAMLI